MSERVRMAMALDSVEEMAAKCAEYAKSKAEAGEHMQNELSFVLDDEIATYARVYGVDEKVLMRNALQMLKNALCNALYGVCDVRYIQPYMVDGSPVGVSVRFYVLRRSA